MNDPQRGIEAPIRRDFARSLAACIGITLLLHVPTFFGGLYGEQDTARLVNDALLWARGNIRDAGISEYRYYSSPGYIWLTMQLLNAADWLGVHVAVLLNLLNLFCSAVIMVPLLALFTRLAGAAAAFWAGVCLAFIPTFWLAGLYGFPTLIALLFLSAAALLYDLSLEATAPTRRWQYLGGATVCLTICILIKSDAYLGVLVLPLLAVHRGAWHPARIWPIGIVVGAPVLVSIGLSSMLATASTAEFAQGWQQQYGFELSRLLSRGALRTLARDMGRLSVPAFTLGVLAWLWRRRASLALLAVLWAFVPWAFWASRPADSPRHHVQTAIPVAFGIGAAVASLRRPTSRALAVGLLLSVNFFADPPSGSTLLSSGNLVETGRRIRAGQAVYRDGAARFAALEVPRKAVLGSFSNPYFDNAVLMGAETVLSAGRMRRGRGDAIEMWFVRKGRVHVSTSVRVRRDNAPALARMFSAEGYAVYSIEFCDSMPPVDAPRGARPGGTGSPGAGGGWLGVCDIRRQPGQTAMCCLPTGAAAPSSWR